MNTLAENPELAEMERLLSAEAEASDAGAAPAKSEAAATAKDGVRTPDAGSDGTTTGQDAAGATAGKEAESKATASSAATSPEAGAKKPEEAKDAKDSKDTKFTKAKKDAERLDRSWKALNEDKDSFRAEQDKFRKEREDFEAKRTAALERQPARDSAKQYTPEQLEAAAVEFENDGNVELAQKARTVANQIREETGRVQGERQAAAIKQAKDAAWRDAVKDHPELADANHALTKSVVELHRLYPVLASYPEGIKHAVEVVKLQEQAARAVTAEKRVVELEAENKQLREATSIKSGPAGGGPTKATNFNDMTLEQQEAWLESHKEEACSVG